LKRQSQIWPRPWQLSSLPTTCSRPHASLTTPPSSSPTGDRERWLKPHLLALSSHHPRISAPKITSLVALA